MATFADFLALTYADRVKETTTTTGTGTLTLAGAVDDFQSFAGVGNGNSCAFATVFGGDWEVAIGTYTASGTTLSRTTILASSNGGSAVNWGAGTKEVFAVAPAELVTDMLSEINGKITSAGVTYENLDANGDVGMGSTQVAAGDHDHTGVYEPADAAIAKTDEAETVTSTWAFSGASLNLSGGASHRYIRFISTGSDADKQIIAARADTESNGSARLSLYSLTDADVLGAELLRLRHSGGVAVGNASGGAPTTLGHLNAVNLLINGSQVALESGVRELLTANRTYYVNGSLGSDSNDGLSSGAGAFATIGKAIEIVSGTIDLGPYNVTISVAAGTYTAALSLRQYVGSGTVTIQGAGSSTIISVSGNNAVTADGLMDWTFSSLKVQTSGAGNAFYALNGGVIRVNGCEIGACAFYGFSAEFRGTIIVDTSLTISGNMIGWAGASDFGLLWIKGITVTLSGTPAWSSNGVIASRGAYVRVNGVTFSGSATGKRYTQVSNALIFTNGGGASYLPGNSAGSSTAFAGYS